MVKKKKKKRASRIGAVASALDRANRREKEGGFTPIIKFPQGVEQFKIDKAGTYRFDILPYQVGAHNPYFDEGEWAFERTYYTHRDVGPNKERAICLARTFDKPCPICEYRNKLMKRPDDHKKEIKDLRPSERQLFNVIDVKDREKGVQIFDWPFWTFGKTLDSIVRSGEEGEGYDQFYDLQKGFTIKCVFVQDAWEGGSSLKVEPSLRFVDRRVKYTDDILDEVHCLDDLLIEESYDNLREKFLGGGVGDDDDDDDDDALDEDDGGSVDLDDDEASSDVDDDDDDDDDEGGDNDEEEEDDDEGEEDEEGDDDAAELGGEEDEDDDSGEGDDEDEGADFWDDDDEEAKPKAKKKAKKESKKEKRR